MSSSLFFQEDTCAWFAPGCDALKQLVRERNCSLSNWLFFRHIWMANVLSAFGHCVRMPDEGMGIM